MRKYFLVFATLLGSFVGYASDSAEVGEHAQKIRCVVSIEPYRLFLESMLGDDVEVTVLLPQGMDPHHFIFSPKLIRSLEESDVWIQSGLPFEELVVSKFESSFKGQVLELVESDHFTAVCDHEGHHHHHHDHHSEMDPHQWTSPRLAKAQVLKIAEFLSRLDVSKNASISENLPKLLARFDRIDHKIESLLKTTEKHYLLVYHPAWGHFCNSYGLEQVAVEREGKPLSAKQLMRLMKGVDEQYFDSIVIQPQIQSKVLTQVGKELGVSVKVVDPLQYEYFEMLEKMVAILRR